MYTMKKIKLRALLLSVTLLLLTLPGCKKPGEGSEPTPESATVTISPSTAKLKVGETLKLTATITPKDAKGIKLSWSSSDPEVAQVDRSSGEVKGVKAGKAIITARLSSGKSATCTLEVIDEGGKTPEPTPTPEPNPNPEPNPTPNPEPNPGEYTYTITTDQQEYTVEVGKKITIKPTLTPAPAEGETVSFSFKGGTKYIEGQGEITIALVNNDGSVEGTNEGDCTVTISAKGAKPVECKVIVKKATQETVTLPAGARVAIMHEVDGVDEEVTSKLTFSTYTTSFTLTPVVLDKDGQVLESDTAYEFDWSSNNSKLVEYNDIMGNFNLPSGETGSCKLTATLRGSNASASVEVEIVAPKK